MAYSDYGGMVYLNGKARHDRCDYVHTEEYATVPGMWPGFAALVQTGSAQAAENRFDYPNGHAVLGDDVFLCLYKQASTWFYWHDRRIELSDMLEHSNLDLHHDGVQHWNPFQHRYRNYPSWGAKPVLDTEWLTDNKFIWKTLLPDGFSAEVAYRHVANAVHPSSKTCPWGEPSSGNYYQFAVLECPNGDVWSGWSGYGVGAGHEDSHDLEGYGYSSRMLDEYLNELFDVGITPCFQH